ncbi:MAG: aldo/keto reductase [Victivallaceae bacterium]|nr:aldo/keto reductase [Victivallaceae bacterium]
MEYIELNNRVKIPQLGLGTYPMNGMELIKATIRAVHLGYECFDTSAAYGNEYYLSWGLRLCMKRRKKLFIITKVSNKQQRRGNIRSALLESLEKLHTDYIDLYLLHWPNPDTYIDCWRQMEELYRDGLVRAIGVSNFHAHHLDRLLSKATVIPAVNEIELHPLLSQQPLVDYCTKLGIKIICYSPLARMDNKLMKNDVLLHLAECYGRQVPQIILRWNIQKGYATIPKSSKKERLRQNLEIFNFELTHDEMEQIDNLNCDYRVRYDPDHCDFTKL